MDRELDETFRTKRRWRRGLGGVAAVAALGVAFLVLPGFLRPSLARGEVRVGVVDRGPIEAVLSASGTVVPAFEQILSSPIEARVLRVLKRPGATVVAGEELLALDTKGAELDLAKLGDRLAQNANEQRQRQLALDKALGDLAGRIETAQLDADLAAAQAAQSGKLADLGLASAEALRVAEVAAKKAAIVVGQLRRSVDGERRATEAGLASLALDRSILEKEAGEARRQLELATVSAERPGVVTWTVAEEGTAVHRGDMLARLADLGSFRVEATISDVHASRLALGLPVRVALDGEDLAGRLESVHPTIDNGAVRFNVALADPHHQKLRQNLRVDVLVVTGVRPAALRLPKRAAATETGRDSVFVIRGNEAVRRPLRLGVAGALYDEVLAGVAAGDRVILSDLSDFDGVDRIRLK